MKYQFEQALKKVDPFSDKKETVEMGHLIYNAIREFRCVICDKHITESAFSICDECVNIVTPVDNEDLPF